MLLMQKEPIFITGMGAVSAAGVSVQETLASFRKGARNGGRVTLFETALDYPAFEVKHLPAAMNREGQRTIALALAATEEALVSAGMPGDLTGYRVGVCLGTTVASQLNDLEFYR